jgi:aspartate/methionine/tyrosine aminotransferase
MSKAYALSGLRIGWITIKEPKLLQKLKDLNGLATPCKPAPSELLATIALRAKDKVLARSHKIIDDNLPSSTSSSRTTPTTFAGYAQRARRSAFPS